MGTGPCCLFSFQTFLSHENASTKGHSAVGVLAAPRLFRLNGENRPPGDDGGLIEIDEAVLEAGKWMAPCIKPGSHGSNHRAFSAASALTEKRVAAGVSISE